MISLSNQQTEPSQNANDLALLHMQEKYGEEFTYLAPWGNSMTGTREFLASCKSLPGQPVLVRIENFKTANPIYSDNYWEEYFKDDTIDYFQRISSEVFGDAIIHYEPSRLSVTDMLVPGTDFVSFYNDTNTFITVYVEIKEGVYLSKDQFSEFYSKLNGSQGQIMVSVIVVEDNLYGTMDSSALSLLPYQDKSIANAYGETNEGTFRLDVAKEA